ncbi:MAG: MerR family transcriptional regulator [Paludibacter sp.]|nr:MerR family transcriptional regulator [Paludibacter sp.]
MLISEVSRITSLTKKAIEYYAEQRLVFPTILENGYRDFNKDDVECLSKIYILRKLELSTEEIRTVLADKTGYSLQKLSVQKELKLQREKIKKTILDKLSCGKSYTEISMDLKVLEQGVNISEKLLEVFPGYYGRFICMHFARFLNEPITTEEQQTAYQEIIEFLDNTSSLELPEDLREFLNEKTMYIGTDEIGTMLENTKKSIDHFDQFLTENKEWLEEYLLYKQSEAYKNSSVYKIQEILKAFYKTSGYYNIFIPTMKKLSASYSEYCKQMEIANEKLLSHYPQIINLSYI